MKRWPVDECLHQRVAEGGTVTNFVGQVVRVVPDRCLDCGYELPKRDHQ